MIIIDYKYHVVVSEINEEPQFFDLDEHQIKILQSWLPESKAKPEVKEKAKTWLKRATLYAHLTRTDPKSGFAQAINCTLSSEEGCVHGLQLSEHDQTFNPAMFDLVPKYGTPYIYEVRALYIKPYQDTSSIIKYYIYTIILVGGPQVYKFYRVHPFTEPLVATDDPSGDNDCFFFGKTYRQRLVNKLI